MSHKKKTSQYSETKKKILKGANPAKQMQTFVTSLVTKEPKHRHLTDITKPFDR